MIRTAIIGAGGISRSHVEALSKIDNVIVKGVVDINSTNAQKVAEKCSCKAYDKIEDVLDFVDMVHILTPPSTHKEYALKAIKAGKHVLCEKPMTVEIEDAEEMVKAAKKYGVKLMTAFNHRYRAGYKILYDTVKSGKLGDIINCWCYRLGEGSGFAGRSLSQSWRTDPNYVCGMSIESLSHDIDMMRGLIGGVADIVDVRANTVGTIKELPQFDNNASVVFTLANGGTGLIHASWSCHLPMRVLGVIGTKGSAMILGPNLWEFTQFRLKTEDMAYETITNVNDVFDNKSYVEETKHFLNCIEKDIQPMTSGEDGLYTLKVSQAILKSHRDNVIVKL